MAQPTLQDLLNLISECAKTTDSKIEQSFIGITKEVKELKDESDINKIKVIELEKNVELLKQDKIINNVKISGIPITNIDPIALVYNICNLLDIELTDDEFDAYKTKTANFVIIRFESYRKKALFLRKMSDRKSIMTEEIFDNVTSNSQIYACDQLTPYFANLFHLTRMAKKDGKIYAASQRGGKIRIKTNENSPFQFIFSERELTQIIKNEEINECASTSTINTKNNTKSSMTNKQQKRRAEENIAAENNREKLKKLSDKNIKNKKTKQST